MGIVVGASSGRVGMRNRKTWENLVTMNNTSGVAHDYLIDRDEVEHLQKMKFS